MGFRNYKPQTTYKSKLIGWLKNLENDGDLNATSIITNTSYINRMVEEAQSKGLLTEDAFNSSDFVKDFANSSGSLKAYIAKVYPNLDQERERDKVFKEAQGIVQPTPTPQTGISQALADFNDPEKRAWAESAAAANQATADYTEFLAQQRQADANTTAATWEQEKHEAGLAEQEKQRELAPQRDNTDAQSLEDTGIKASWIPKIEEKGDKYKELLLSKYNNYILKMKEERNWSDDKTLLEWESMVGSVMFSEYTEVYRQFFDMYGYWPDIANETESTDDDRTLSQVRNMVADKGERTAEDVYYDISNDRYDITKPPEMQEATEVALSSPEAFASYVEYVNTTPEGAGRDVWNWKQAYDETLYLNDVENVASQMPGGTGDLLRNITSGVHFGDEDLSKVISGDVYQDAVNAIKNETDSEKILDIIGKATALITDPYKPANNTVDPLVDHALTTDQGLSQDVSDFTPVSTATGIPTTTPTTPTTPVTPTDQSSDGSTDGSTSGTDGGSSSLPGSDGLNLEKAPGFYQYNLSNIGSMKYADFLKNMGNFSQEYKKAPQKFSTDYKSFLDEFGGA